MLDLHHLKQQLQNHLSDGLVTIVGSGLSCAEGLPGMGEIAGHLCATIPASLTPADRAEWTAIAALIADHGLEAALLKHPPSPGIEAAISAATGKLIADREQAVIADVFNGARRLRLSRLLPHMLKPNAGMPIITTNYDRLVEVAVEDAGLGVDTMFVGQFAGELNPKESHLSFCRDVTLRHKQVTKSFRPRALVFKPHGSLDWYLRNGRPVRYGGNLPGAARLIITPGHNKFRNGYDSPFDIHRERANKAIDQATRFLVLGYGFNDDHLETHLIPVIKRGCPTLLLTFQLSEVAERLAFDHANVTALDAEERGGVKGTRIIRTKSAHFVPDLALWDVDAFVTEVLEP